MINKTADIIIDNESTNNLISTKAVKALKLPLEKHDRPYQLEWIKNEEAVNVNSTCLEPLSTGKTYSEKIV